MLHHPRRGFTLIELLVVIAIIAILIGLLLPAVQRVREAGNRTRCINNMMQLNLAMGQYESKYGRIPASRITTGGKLTGTIVHFLPFLEQDAIWNKYDFTKHWHEQTQEVLGFQADFMLCPSNPNRSQRGEKDIAGKQLRDMGVCDYTTVTQIMTGSPSAYSQGLMAPYTYTAVTNQGLMGKDKITRFKDVTDGLSMTVSFVEDVGRPMKLEGRKVPTGTYPLTDVDLGSSWADEAHPMDLQGYAFNGTTKGGPCVMNCSNYNEIYSMHGDGAVFGFGDLSVKYVGRKIDAKIMAAIITKQGKETETIDQ